MDKDIKKPPDIITSSMMLEKRNLKGDRRILLMILPLIVQVCLSVWSLKSTLPVLGIESSGGVWDARNFDFSSATASLRGEIEYVPYVLLTPEEFIASEHIIVGIIPEGIDYLTSRIRILASPGNYAFLRTTPDYGCRIYVNGEYIGGAGTPSESRETAVPGEKDIFFTAQPRDGIIEIVVQASNYVYKENTNHTSWRMGNEEQLSRNIAGKTAAAIFVMGFLILLFVVHMLLFLMLPSYRANLWIALLCLVWAFRTGCTGIKILLTLIPRLSWTAAFRIEYLAIPATLVLVTLAYHQLFPGVLQKGFRIALICVAGIFTAAYLFTPTLFMSKTILYMEIVAIITGIYVLLRLIMKVRKPNTEQSVILIGLVVVFTALIMDTLWYNNIISHNDVPGAIMEYAFAGFSMFQMTALFFGTMREMAAAREREKLLATENTALDSLSRMKTEYIADMSHEINRPLTLIAAGIDYVDKQVTRTGGTEKTLETLSLIREETGRLGRMINGMQKLASISDGGENRKRTDFAAMLRNSAEVFRLMLEKKNNELRLTIAPGLPDVFVEADKFPQVLTNLLSNAARHTRDGLISITEAYDGTFITVCVTDTGEGIDPELMPNIFERGVSGSGGTGYGLYICKIIVEAHGGTIGIESEPDKGTAVTFTVPVYGGQEAGHGV